MEQQDLDVIDVEKQLKDILDKRVQHPKLSLQGLKCLHAAFKIEDKILKLRHELEAEKVSIVSKFEHSCEPFRMQREAIINGTADLKSFLSKEQLAEVGEDATVAHPSLTNDFWLTALKNAGDFYNLLQISEADEDALRYLANITTQVTPLTPPLIETVISFYFNQNPYFENKVLTKTFGFELGDERTTISRYAKGTTIIWKKDITKARVETKNSNGETTSYVVSKPSIFNYFAASASEDEPEKLADEFVLCTLWRNLERDHVKCYLNQTEEPFSFFFDFSDEEDEDEDEDEDEEDDEDEDEDVNEDEDDVGDDDGDEY